MPLGVAKTWYEREVNGLYRDADAGTHLRGITDYSSKVGVTEGDETVYTISLLEIGGDPIVLIDNLTYPIAKTQRNDGAVLVQLRKMDTTNTRITDDELYGDRKSNV